MDMRIVRPLKAVEAGKALFVIALKGGNPDKAVARQVLELDNWYGEWSYLRSSCVTALVYGVCEGFSDEYNIGDVDGAICTMNRVLNYLFEFYYWQKELPSNFKVQKSPSGLITVRFEINRVSVDFRTMKKEIHFSSTFVLGLNRVIANALICTRAHFQSNGLESEGVTEELRWLQEYVAHKAMYDKQYSQMCIKNAQLRNGR